MHPEALIRTFIEEAFNNGNLSILDDIIHDFWCRRRLRRGLEHWDARDVPCLTNINKKLITK